MPQDIATALDRLESSEDLQKLRDRASRLHSADPQMLLDAVKRAHSVNERSARIALLRPELPALEREVAELVLTTGAQCEASVESRDLFEYGHALAELAYYYDLFRETGEPELVPIVRELEERMVAAKSRCEASGRELSTEAMYAMADHVWAKHADFIIDQECRETERIIERIQNQPRAETCSPATARTAGDRDTVRRARPRRGARPSGKGDGDPDPEAIARNIVSAIQAAAPLLVAPLTRLFATPPALIAAVFTRLSAPHPVDPWVDQAHLPFRRVGPKLCREAMARGDDRAAVRGRVHFMRQSLIDEILQGAPQPKRAPNKAPPEAHLSPLEKVERELDLIFAEAAE